MLYVDGYYQMVNAPQGIYDAYNCFTSLHQHIIDTNAGLMSAKTQQVFCNFVDVRANERALESIINQVEIDGYDAYGRCVFVSPAIDYPNDCNTTIDITAKVNDGTADVFVFITAEYPSKAFRHYIQYASQALYQVIGDGFTRFYVNNAMLPNTSSVNRKCWMSIWIVGDKTTADQKAILGSVYWATYPVVIDTTHSKTGWGTTGSD